MALIRNRIGSAPEMLGPSIRVPPCHCPYCHYLLDASSGLTKARRPYPGAFSICISCAQPLVFNLDLTLRKCFPGEFEAARARDVEFAVNMDLAMAAVRQVDRRKKPKSRPPHKRH